MAIQRTRLGLGDALATGMAPIASSRRRTARACETVILLHDVCRQRHPSPRAQVMVKRHNLKHRWKGAPSAQLTSRTNEGRIWQRVLLGVDSAVLILDHCRSGKFGAIEAVTFELGKSRGGVGIRVAAARAA